MLDPLRELASYRELIYMITWRDIRIKYKQSIMGFMWAIFMPMLIVSAGIMVKYVFAKFSGNPLSMAQIATVAVKALPWSFFVASLRFATNSLTSNINLVTKIYFPKEIFPISAVLSQLFDFSIASVVLVTVLIVAQVGVSIYLFFIPLLLALLVFLVIGLGIFLAAANLFFRDVKYIVEVVITYAIFFTPVFYETEMFGDWASIILINPVAPILESFNDCIVRQAMPQLDWLFYSAMISFLLPIFGFIYFKKLEPVFAERI
ncbi:hypothetical protein DCC62_01645 [candidate division KSB1 bacterium]|nr:MAG: hypothetical protein DCC62_01645 [candidate division KSB1 bacterium]